jgi:hypothetical protein
MALLDDLLSGFSLNTAKARPPSRVHLQKK